MENVWWKKPMRVMQFNLQVRDTAGMDAEKIARETESMAANVAVMNVGGIYAWYQSSVRHHHVNEFLPKGRDLVQEWIEAFHRRGIRFVARFDFSLADDITYLQKPQWFARRRDKSPYFRGERRMGDWSLYLTTCACGGYRNEEVGVPVIREVLTKYDIDGIFFNAPFAPVCFCERCRRKYFQKYGKEMPEREEEFERDWLSFCTKEHIGVIYRAIKEKRPEVPMILYYNPFAAETKAADMYDRDSIFDRYETADLICTESQNVLSRGVKHIPDTVHPVLSMKAGLTETSRPRPLGIIHSCPGMDWRHVGMPVDEYLPWMCQIPASGGTIWHSVTGYNDTITDKRVIRAITKADQMIMKSERDMEGTVSMADVLLFWNGARGGRDWADILLRQHIQFDLMHDYDIASERLFSYQAAIVPEDFPLDETLKTLLTSFAQKGGGILAERSRAEEISGWKDVFGIQGEVLKGEYLHAGYMRLEKAGAELGAGMDTDKLAFRGEVNYCTAQKDTQVLMTLVPPFAPLDAAGAPPERASIPVTHTDIPLCTVRACGEGKIMLLPFSFHGLAAEFRLKDHYQAAADMIRMLAGGRMLMETNMPSGVFATMFEKENQILIHLVNEVGERPLMEQVPLSAISCSIRLPEGNSAADVKSVIAEAELEYRQQGNELWIRLSRLEIWDMLSVKLKKERTLKEKEL